MDDRRRRQRLTAGFGWGCCSAGLTILALLGLAGFIIALVNNGRLNNQAAKDMILMDNVTNLNNKDMILMDNITSLQAKDMILMDNITDLRATDVIIMTQISEIQEVDEGLQAKDMLLMSQISDLQAKDMLLMSQIASLDKNSTAAYDRTGLGTVVLDMASNPVDWVPIYQPSWVTQTSPTEFYFNESGVYVFEVNLPTVLAGTAGSATEAMTINWLLEIVPTIASTDDDFTSWTYFGDLGVDLNVRTLRPMQISAGELIHIQLNLQVPNTWNTNTGANPGTNDIAVAIVSPNSCCTTGFTITKVI